MNQITTLLQSLNRIPNTNYALKYSPGKAKITLPNGRTQSITITRQGDLYILTSTVLGTRRMQLLCPTPKQKVDIICQRNRATEVVTFTQDKKGRLIGVITQPAATMQKQELTYYLAKLAQECDRLEYLLTGGDCA